MSVFLEERNELIEEEEKEEEKTNRFIEYYKNVLPGIIPLELYKNTKFLTADKINGGLLTKEEIENIKEEPTGYCFNLKDSGYFIIDIDINEEFKIIDNNVLKDDFNLLNCNIDELPKSIEISEISLSNFQKKKKIKITNIINILFCELFQTPYIKTASKGYHFYFKNDLTNEQIKEIFGINKSKFIKCISLFYESIDIDIFIDNKIDNESRLVLPFSKVIIENKEIKNDINAFKTCTVQYSGFRYYKNKEFRKSSDLIKWLKNYIDPKKFNEINNNINKNNNNWNERGKVIGIYEIDREKYLNYFKEDLKILTKNIKEIKTYATYPFNLYILICTLAYFPLDMHYDLLIIIIKYLSSIMSENCIKQLLNYYYHIITDNHQKEFWKSPSYFEAIINSKFNTNLNNKYRFKYENDNNNNNNSSEEILEDDDDDDDNNISPKKIIIEINKKYPKFPLPNNFN